MVNALRGATSRWRAAINNDKEWTMKQLKNTTLALLLAGVGALAPMMAQAAWPTTDQVRIVVPYPPGTEPDILARDLGVHLNKATGKVFLIENRPGANAIIGTDNVVKAKGDGSA